MQTDQRKTELFVFCIDSYLDGLSGKDWQENLAVFCRELRYVIITQKDNVWQKKYPDLRIQVLPYKTIGLSLLNYLVVNFSVEIQNIVLISDDFWFLDNESYLFSKRIFINREGIDFSYGKYPDEVYNSLSDFFNNFNSDSAAYLGERIISSETSVSGKLIRTALRYKDKQLPVFAGGRYYSHSHIYSLFDLYSYALIANKNEKSKLKCSFDRFFIRILEAEIRDYMRLGYDINGICCVLDFNSNEEKNKFSEILKTVSTELGIDDLSPYLKKVRETQPQKTKGSKTDREMNVKGAFKCDVSMRGKRIVIFDDIMTSGSTMNECAHILFTQGAAEIFCAVLALNQFDRQSDFAPIISRFKDNYVLRMRSSDWCPFFTAKDENKTISYKNVMDELYADLNEYVLKMSNASDFDEDDFSDVF